MFNHEGTVSFESYILGDSNPTQHSWTSNMVCVFTFCLSEEGFEIKSIIEPFFAFNRTSVIMGGKSIIFSASSWKEDKFSSMPFYYNLISSF